MNEDVCGWEANLSPNILNPDKLPKHSSRKSGTNLRGSVVVPSRVYSMQDPPAKIKKIINYTPTLPHQ